MEKLEQKILITGAKGFVGKNLVATLRALGYKNLYCYDIDNSLQDLDNYCKDCEFVYNLAGINRPTKTEEFYEGNRDFGVKLLGALKKYGNKSPIVLTSSIQAKLDNDYGKSKKAGEDYLFEYGKENGIKTFIYRLPNVFGKWSRPNYNSAVATFCYNTARGLEITINDERAELNLVYIDDVVDEFVNALDNKANNGKEFCSVKTTYKTTVGEVVKRIQSFFQSRKNLQVPNMSDELTKKLYSTYLSFLPEQEFSYPLKMNVDPRGSFTEIIKGNTFGQVSVNVSKPNITKGNHWHHTKNEKFLVVSGQGVIRFRKPDSQEIIEYFVSGEKMEVVDIPCGYTHNIENLGQNDLVTIMWCNESFDPNKPDTIFLEV